MLYVNFLSVNTELIKLIWKSQRKEFEMKYFLYLFQRLIQDSISKYLLLFKIETKMSLYEFLIIKY